MTPVLMELLVLGAEDYTGLWEARLAVEASDETLALDAALADAASWRTATQPGELIHFLATDRGIEVVRSAHYGQ
jgi:hypothetical protein